MIDQDRLSEFWDKDVPDEFKHWMNSDFNLKVVKYQNDINCNLVRQIDFSSIKVALDWGCGGGLSSLLLSEHSNVIALDIAESSLRQCSKYLKRNGKRLTASYKLDDINKLVINENIDLLFSASVIQHFPSFEYWKRVVSFWRSLQPKWIAIQTRHGDQNRSNEEAYFDDTKNYILALYLTTDEVISSFHNIYKLIYHKIIDDNYSMYEYFVFQNK